MAEEIVDVLIIGSGHSGGMAAKILTEKGISCLMLNAGPVADVQKDTEVKPAYALPYRGFKQPGRLSHVFQSNEFNANTWVDEQEVPYTYDAQNPYNWVRVRLFGGRSLFWSRQSFRLSDYEFKAKSHDGFGDDWPISLADVAPYYSRVEEIFRVRGHADGLPQYPDGNFVPDDAPWTGCMQRFVDAGKAAGIQVCKARSAQGINGLASSVNLLLPDAFATGKLRAIPNVVVRELRVDKNTGLVNEAHFVDRLSRREMSVKAKVVVLAAGTLESTRLLLNSRIANSSGVMGHYLVDQVYGPGIVCSVPEARDGKGGANLMGGSALVPRFRNINSRHPKFIRGYALNVFSSKGAMDPRNFATYGADLQHKLDSYHGSGFSTGIMGEVLPHYEHCVSIDKDVVDAWDIPVLHIQTKYTDNEFNMARDAVDTSIALAEAAGFEVLTKNYDPNPPGYSIHELGTCRMGDDPKSSVLNKWCQSHDIKNLFVVDASSFVSGGWQNPTMTILALSMRSSEFLAEQMRQGNV
ncbi:Glucose-methanol-choline (GMC) oxidoreductase:NAD binding site [Acidisarcina polymorpha]|uniref:Glucose-methanol-choline (GMC) oxidoreductase:NAD binding site n=1 Tax=Acidisarcina polymorpha TaxID=2211140 RepID=A0A2Z5G4L8_9BACT|nr:GMC family oxidoreductase [Acidisarcina polymorpha]AXC14143.1 Glucose-methanol-choline (GMC) oxidoreductase:NAD binding site [Acidisarcina polymorpha]